MPPVRNMANVKPLKTERTHEENQERAYIAASRRSDRSIEARLESAKRASEVHKKRTGRALRVTQEDVENEEMYEEEDGDLQMNFRNLAAQWYANSPEFNRKLQAYLASQTMVNTTPPNFAMGSQMNNVSAPQYPVNPFLAQLVQQRIPQTNLSSNQQPQSPQNQQSNQFPTPQSPTTIGQMVNLAGSYRQSPYPMPTPGLRSPSIQSHRSASFASPDEVSGTQFNTHNQKLSIAERRNSTPLHSGQSSVPADVLAKIQSQSNDASSPTNEQAVAPSNPNSQASTPQPLVPQNRRSTVHNHSTSTPVLSGFENQNQAFDLGTYSNNAAAEPGTYTFYNGHGSRKFYPGGIGDIRNYSNYTYNPNLTNRVTDESGSGMDQTLSPSSLTIDTAVDSQDFDAAQASSAASYDAPLPSAGLDYNWQFNEMFTTADTADSGPPPFSQDEWSSFLNTDALEDGSS